jgi:hypothetical protein
VRKKFSRAINRIDTESKTEFLGSILMMQTEEVFETSVSISTLT